eukprot:CAMPEP_0119105412 /NCGR_PEP_ID=MMETSP1180-20130426/3374_1 /TAXON_ID=3052 ORGANISM="Chlamydomonas cf sp, Strain CCMP681" /NCGR_SAMPLE_ID=MMETSP1180 /ASSEMBLY_ACC=CAM_ASM_000741 /LENGTH=386 /DNA_ID=CAMNT_0007090451 /DNA_START=38 /DNA_END=1198 /DNA_ORIENTATION=-
MSASRGVGLLRVLQRLPAASTSFGEASSALRATLCSNVLSGSAQSSGSLHGLQHSSSGFGSQMPYSFAAQMHTLINKEEENKQTASAPGSAMLASVTQATTALTLLPVKPRSALARRNMASAAGAHAHHIDSNQAHPFHIVAPSPWPFCASMSSMMMMMGMSGWFHCIPHCGAIMFAGGASTILTAVAWWRDCVIEADMGMHSELQKTNFINGIWIFIVSEAALFFGLLWSCVHLGMSPNVMVHMQWPPVGIDAIGWEGRAMVMSAVLAASYYSANVAMVAKDPKVVMTALGTTVGLGALFLADQYLEYSTAPFNLTDGPYGTTFFMTTGFHGFHVLVGSLWLLAAMLNYPRTNKPTTTLKGAVLYWHFVDIVWIAVYGIIYAAQL